MRKLFLLLMMFSAAGIADAWADGPAPNDVQLGQPTYGGNGCPSGTASAVLSPDNKELSVLFDQYQASAGGTSGLTIDRKSCNIAIPVHVPQGWSVSIFSSDYRGFNALPSGASTRFNASYFFAGQAGPTYSKYFFGPLNEDYLLNNTLAASAVVWSACGTDVTLRANTSLMTQTNRAREETLSTVDSADVRASLIYDFQWRQCR